MIIQFDLRRLSPSALYRTQTAPHTPQTFAKISWLRKRSQMVRLIIRPDLMEINKVFHKYFTVNSSFCEDGRFLYKRGPGSARKSINYYVFLYLNLPCLETS